MKRLKLPKVCGGDLIFFMLLLPVLCGGVFIFYTTVRPELAQQEEVCLKVCKITEMLYIKKKKKKKQPTTNILTSATKNKTNKTKHKVI